MVAATSASTSSSPGKPISPHTPHTPAIPSRLSANSIIDYGRQDPTEHRYRPPQDDLDAQSDAAASEETTVDDATANAGAIDIPLSPRPFATAYRRSSSVAQRRVENAEDEMSDLYGLRSASLGAEDRQPPTMSELISRQESVTLEDTAVRGEEQREPVDLAVQQESRLERPASTDYRKYGPQQITSVDGSNSASGSASGGSSTHQVYRSRMARGGAGRGHGSGSSFGAGVGNSHERADSGGSGNWDRRGGRSSFSRPENRFEEDEPFLFAMSDIGGTGGGSRRSLEEGRGGEPRRAAGAANRRGGSGSGSGGNYAPW